MNTAKKLKFIENENLEASISINPSMMSELMLTSINDINFTIELLSKQKQGIHDKKEINRISNNIELCYKIIESKINLTCSVLNIENDTPIVEVEEVKEEDVQVIETYTSIDAIKEKITEDIQKSTGIASLQKIVPMVRKLVNNSKLKWATDEISTWVIELLGKNTTKENGKIIQMLPPQIISFKNIDDLKKEAIERLKNGEENDVVYELVKNTILGKKLTQISKDNTSTTIQYKIEKEIGEWSEEAIQSVFVLIVKEATQSVEKTEEENNADRTINKKTVQKINPDIIQGNVIYKRYTVATENSEKWEDVKNVTRITDLVELCKILTADNEAELAYNIACDLLLDKKIEKVRYKDVKAVRNWFERSIVNSTKVLTVNDRVEKVLEDGKNTNLKLLSKLKNSLENQTRSGTVSFTIYNDILLSNCTADPFDKGQDARKQWMKDIVTNECKRSLIKKLKIEYSALDDEQKAKTELGRVFGHCTQYIEYIQRKIETKEKKVKQVKQEEKKEENTEDIYAPVREEVMASLKKGNDNKAKNLLNSLFNVMLKEKKETRKFTDVFNEFKEAIKVENDIKPENKILQKFNVDVIIEKTGKIEYTQETEALSEEQAKQDVKDAYRTVIKEPFETVISADPERSKKETEEKNEQSKSEDTTSIIKETTNDVQINDTQENNEEIPSFTKEEYAMINTKNKKEWKDYVILKLSESKDRNTLLPIIVEKNKKNWGRKVKEESKKWVDIIINSSLKEIKDDIIDWTE